MNLVKNYLVTLMKSFFVITIAASAFASCKKDKSEDPPQAPSPVEGYWVGSYNTIGVLGSSNYAILVKPGGQARIYDMNTKTDTTTLPELSKANGVWTLNGNILQTTYQSGAKTVNTSATLNAAYNSMTGTWGWNGEVKGNLTLNK